MTAAGPHTTGRRIVLAFAAILALFGVTLAVIVASLHRIGQAEDEVAHLDHVKHAGHSVAALAREQYIHQAHTLLVWNQSHLGHYTEVANEANTAAQHLRDMVSPSELAEADAIARLVSESDRRFRAEVLPAIEKDDRSRANSLHEDTEAVVVDVVKRNERLNTILEARAATARERAESIRSRTNVAIIICFGLAILLSAAVGGYLLRSITRPMALLRKGVERVGRGDLEHQIALEGRDEFAELASAFNQMTRNLASHHAELLEAHRLASIGQVASGVAHEINNPLGVILGYTRILRRDSALRDREELSIIEDEVRQSQRIVAGLLDLARPVRLDRTDVDIGELIRDVAARMEESGQTDGIVITLEPKDEARVSADEARLRQIVTNLLGNAIEAARDTGAAEPNVTIRWRRDEKSAILEVLDRGPGISPEAVKHLFEPFFSTKSKGHGLGLAIARTLARAHQGDVILEPRHDGTGARACLTLPRQQGSMQ